AVAGPAGVVDCDAIRAFHLARRGALDAGQTRRRRCADLAFEFPVAHSVAPRSEEMSLGVELVDPMVARIGYVHVAGGLIDADVQAPNSVIALELSVAGTGGPEGEGIGMAERFSARDCGGTQLHCQGDRPKRGDRQSTATDDPGRR